MVIQLIYITKTKSPVFIFIKFRVMEAFLFVSLFLPWHIRTHTYTRTRTEKERVIVIKMACYESISILRTIVVFFKRPAVHFYCDIPLALLFCTLLLAVIVIIFTHEHRSYRS